MAESQMLSQENLEKREIAGSTQPMQMPVQAEPRIRDIIDENFGKIPQSIKNRLDEPKISSAVLRILQETQGDAQAQALALFSSVLSHENFHESWIDPESQSFTVPGIIRAINAIFSSTQGKGTVSAVSSIHNLASGSDFGHNSLTDCWEKAFSLILKNAGGENTVHAIELLDEFSKSGQPVSRINSLFAQTFSYAFGKEQGQKARLISQALKNFLHEGGNPDALPQIIAGTTQETAPENERECARLISSLEKVRPIGNLGASVEIVWQGEGAFLHGESKQEALYTFFLMSCTAVAAVSRGQNGEITLVGLAHIDPNMSKEAIGSFFGAFSGQGKTSVYILGGSQANSRRVLESALQSGSVSVESYTYDIKAQEDAVAIDKGGNVYYGKTPAINTPENYKNAFEIDSTKRKNERGIGLRHIR